MSKKHSIKSKLLKGIIIPTFLVLITASTIISLYVKNSIETLRNSELTSESIAVANELNGYFTKYLEITTQFSANVEVQNLFANTTKGNEIIKTEGYSNVMKSLSNSHNTDTENILVCWLADLDSSQCVEDTGYVSEIGDWDITTRDWYSQVMEAKQTIITEPYENSSTGELVSSVISPVFNDKEEIIGVAALDLAVSTLQNVMSKHKIGDTGYFVLSTNNNQIMYHPSSDLIQQPLLEQNLSDNLKKCYEAKDSKSISYSFNGSKNYGYLSKVKSTNWMVLSVLPNSEYKSSIYNIILIIAFIFILGIIILTLLLMKISKSIVSPLFKLKIAASSIAEGNLNVEVDVSGNDEIGEVASAFQQTVSQLKNYISYINEITDVLNEVADGSLAFTLTQEYTGDFEKIKAALLHISETLSSTIQKISETSKQVSGGASQISEGAQSLAEGATDQATTIEQLQASITELADHVENNSEHALLANTKAKEVEVNINNSKNDMYQIVEAMNTISSSANQIETVITAIESIAAQTNLLSLNASIEAARAGEAGRGFAVVANEVGQLANDSASSTKTSSELIQDTLNSVKEGIVIVNQTAENLSKTIEQILDLTSNIEDISNASHVQSEQIEQIKTAVEQISGVITDNSAMAEESAAASSELNQQSQMLNDMIRKFRF